MRQLVRGKLSQVLVAIVIVATAVAVAVGVSRMAYPTIATYPESNGEAAKVQVDASTNTVRITLSADAARRIGVRSVPVTVAPDGGRLRLRIPADAVFYDAEGSTWAYVVRQPLVYEREPITVDSFRDGVAVLLVGPVVGSEVVTVGVAELYGAEVGVGEE
jgi:hypothetical protein